MYRKFLTFILTLAMTVMALSAQDVIKVQVPNIVAADEQFNVTFVIEGESSPSSFSWEPGSDFKLVWGPQKGSSTSISIVNGKRTKSSQTTYTYILLPKAKGTFQIPSATAKIDGKTLTSERSSVEVVSGGSSRSGASASDNQTTEERGVTGDVPDSDLFLKLSLSRTSVVVGEPVTAVLKLYQRASIAGFEDAKFPAFNGFWSQEVQAPTNIEFQRENVNDAIYNAAVLRSWVLIPQQAGDIQIDPAELVCRVNVKTTSASRSIFDSFFEDDYRTVRKRVTTGRQVVHVKSLPLGAPSSFGGGVGSFTMTAHLSKDSLKTHDAASLLVTVSGRGNVSLIEAPKVNFPPDFDVYDAKAVENTDKSNGKTSGSKTFEYPFIPRSHGEFVIGPVEYSYYDVNSHKYVTLTSEPLIVNVLRGEESPSATGQTPAVGTVNRKAVKDLGSDIRFITSALPSFSRNGRLFIASPAFYLIIALLCLLAIAAYFMLRGIAARRADVVGTRNRGANKMARKRLSVAGDFLARNLSTAFYEELHKALMGYVSDKFNIELAEMSRDNIASSLSSAGVPDSLVSEFNTLTEACEFARYAPDSGHDAMNQHYQTALNLISSIDNSMKRRPSSAIVLIPLLFLSTLSLHAAAQDPKADVLWQAGVDAYVAGHWQDAYDAWKSIYDNGVASSELYYNIGNASFKQGLYGKAVLWYERSLRLNPSNKDARFNLEFTSGFVQDDIESVPEFVLVTWGRRFRGIMGANTWAIVFLVLFAVVLALVLLFVLAPSVLLRKTGFFAGLAATFLAAVSLCAAIAQWKASSSVDEAVIMVPVTSVKSAPGADSAKDLFILHEGTVVTIIDRAGGWCDIELDDGRQGWLPEKDVEII